MSSLSSQALKKAHAAMKQRKEANVWRVAKGWKPLHTNWSEMLKQAWAEVKTIVKRVVLTVEQQIASLKYQLADAEYMERGGFQTMRRIKDKIAALEAQL